MRVAIVHDWLVTYAGAERVLEQMIRCLPRADIFAVVDFVPVEQRGFLQGRSVTTSVIQRMPGARTRYRSYLPLMPLAIEQFDVSGYDVVISSSHAVAKGVLTGPDQLHLCMCYSPIRYAWDMQHQYLREARLDRGLKGWLARYSLHRVRIWDARTSNGVDSFIAISDFIARRIRKTYGRESVVIYPPVDVEEFAFVADKDSYYLTASRFVPYKRIDLLIDAFNEMPDRQLIVIGDGPDAVKLRKRANANVTMLGYQPHDVLRGYMQRARAFLFAAEEDFGIVPVEAQACGTPVIAYGRGGSLETIRGLEHEAPTGVFFKEQSVASVRYAVEQFEHASGRIKAAACRTNSLRFAPERFRREFRQLLATELARLDASVELLQSELDVEIPASLQPKSTA